MDLGGRMAAAALTVVALSACSSRSETTTPPPPDLARPAICPGYTPPAQPGKPCRADGDCAATERCTAGGTYDPPPSPVACTGFCGGGCHQAMRPCEPSAGPCLLDGGSAGTCVDDCAACICIGGPGPTCDSRCLPNCTSDGDCASGQRCREGLCVQASCGCDCGINARCGWWIDPDYGMDPSCNGISCFSDADCDCGTCAKGQCWPGPTTCQPNGA